MIGRKALLYKDWEKKEEPVETVTVLFIGTVGCQEGSYIAASVEKENGEVVEVPHNTLKFIQLFTSEPHCCWCNTPTQTTSEGQTCPQCGGRPA